MSKYPNSPDIELEEKEEQRKRREEENKEKEERIEQTGEKRIQKTTKDFVEASLRQFNLSDLQNNKSQNEIRTIPPPHRSYLKEVYKSPSFNYENLNKENFIDKPKSQEHLLNSLKLLVGGRKSFKEIIRQIKRAKKTILINTHIWNDDIIGNKIAKEVYKAAERGIKVEIFKDQLGAVAEISDGNNQTMFHKNIHKNNFLIYFYSISVLYFYEKNIFKRPYPFQKANKLLEKIKAHPNITLNTQEELDDHSKYYIFDEAKMILGGINIGDNYYYKWHDYMVLIQNPYLVNQFQKRIEGAPQNKENKVDFVVNCEVRKENIIDARKFNVRREFIDLFKKAKKSIIIEMPYFGDEKIQNTLIDAANRGVKVDIITPQDPDILKDLNFSMFEDLIKSNPDNISIYFYPDMLHGKMILIDDSIVFMGSGNFTRHTCEKMLEANLLVKGANSRFTNKARKQIERDKRKSKKVDRKEDLNFSPVRVMCESAYIDQEIMSPKKNRVSTVISSIRKSIEKFLF